MTAATAAVIENDHVTRFIVVDIDSNRETGTTVEGATVVVLDDGAHVTTDDYYYEGTFHSPLVVRFGLIEDDKVAEVQEEHYDPRTEKPAAPEGFVEIPGTTMIGDTINL